MKIDNFIKRIVTPKTWDAEEFWRLLETLVRGQGARVETHSEGKAIVKNGSVFGYVMRVDAEAEVREGERAVMFTVTGKPSLDMAGVRRVLGGQAPGDVIAKLSESFRRLSGIELSHEEGTRFYGEGSEPDMAVQVLSAWRRYTGRVFSPVVQSGLDNSVRALTGSWSGVWTFDGRAIHAITVDSEGDAERLYDRMEFHVVRGRQKMGEEPGILEG